MWAEAAKQEQWERKDGHRPQLTGQTVTGAAALVNTVDVFPSSSRMKIEFDAAKVANLKSTTDPAITAIFDRAVADTARQISTEVARSGPAGLGR